MLEARKQHHQRSASGTTAHGELIRPPPTRVLEQDEGTVGRKNSLAFESLAPVRQLVSGGGET